jgi:hypothetical protein
MTIGSQQAAVWDHYNSNMGVDQWETSLRALVHESFSGGGRRWCSVQQQVIIKF